MTEQKKIATSVEIMIHVGQFEHIKINKYAEKNIEYSSKEDMTKQEDVLTDDLISDIIRTMRLIPGKLGKKTNAVAEVEERIEKRIPEWLNSNNEPNIAKKAYESNKIKDNASKETNNKPDVSLDDDLFSEDETSKSNGSSNENSNDEDDLFN